MSLCDIKEMYKSIQMKLQFKEHIFLTKYVSGKDVRQCFDLISMAPYAATYWKYYLIIEQPTPIGCNVHR